MFLRLRPTRPAKDRPCRDCGAETEGPRLQLTVYQPRPQRTPRRWGSLGHASSCCLEDPELRQILRARAAARLEVLEHEDPEGAAAVREALDRLVPRPEAPEALFALGLGDEANEEDVRRAYHALARRKHPDVGGDPADFARINRAYEDALTWVSAR